MVPVQFYSSLDALSDAQSSGLAADPEAIPQTPAPDTQLRHVGTDGPAGTLCSTVHNVGLALVRLPAEGPFQVEVPGGGHVYARPVLPSWWEERGTGK